MPLTPADELPATCQGQPGPLDYFPYGLLDGQTRGSSRCVEMWFARELECLC